MNAWCARLKWMLGVLLLSVALLPGCDKVDTGMGTTAEEDFTLTMEAVDRFVCVGDQTPVTVRLKRTDNSNLSHGLRGEVVITVSANGGVDPSRVSFQVTDDTTQEIFETIIFTARQGGMAEVRGSFRDATALVEITISGLNP